MSRGRIAVVGAGMAGLACAYWLQQAGFAVTVYERNGDVGGRMKTVRRDGFVIDVGAGLLLDTYRDTKQLLHEAGLAAQIEPLRGNFASPRDGTMHLIDMNAMVSGFLKTGLIGLRSKLLLAKLLPRLARASSRLNFHDLGRAAEFDTETVSDYCRRELTPELHDYLLGGLVRTMYLHGPEEASMLELLWEMKNLMGSAFSLRDGMDALPRGVSRGLDVRLRHEVLAVREHAGGVTLGVRDADGRETTAEVDQCVLALDAPGLLRLHGEALSARQRDFLAGQRYCHDVTVHFCLRAEPALDAALVQLPEPEGGDLVALVVDHRKASGRAPPGKGMITAHFHTRWGERMIGEPDQAVMAAATAAVARFVPEVATQLESFHIERWTHAATMMRVGDFTRMRGFMDDIDASSRVRYIGDFMALSTVNVAVSTARRLASELIAGSHAAV